MYTLNNLSLCFTNTLVNPIINHPQNHYKWCVTIIPKWQDTVGLLLGLSHQNRIPQLLNINSMYHLSLVFSHLIVIIVICSLYFLIPSQKPLFRSGTSQLCLTLNTGVPSSAAPSSPPRCQCSAPLQGYAAGQDTGTARHIAEKTAPGGRLGLSG